MESSVANIDKYRQSQSQPTLIMIQPGVLLHLTITSILIGCRLIGVSQPKSEGWSIVCKENNVLPCHGIRICPYYSHLYTYSRVILALVQNLTIRETYNMVKILKVSQTIYTEL